MTLTVDDYQYWQQHGVQLRVWLDGLDVTKVCTFASEDGGYVWLYKRGRIDGHVEILPDGQQPTHRSAEQAARHAVLDKGRAIAIREEVY